MAKQQELIKKPHEGTVDSFEFEEPIRGYPVLQWRGKRPFRSTHYYPAELKETHGESTVHKDSAGKERDWFNRIYWGDNLQVMSHLLREFRSQINLVYIDPPFDSKAEYKRTISLRGKSIQNEHSAFEEKQYTDIWSNDEYLQFMYERLTLLRELLAEAGSIVLHCDWHKAHLLRCLLDEIFGPENFVNEIVWKSQSPSGMKALARQFSYGHETLLWYAKSQERTYNRQYTPYSEGYINERFTKSDERGRYKDAELQDPSAETLDRLKKEGRIVVTSGGKMRIKQYLSELPGVLVDSVWTGIYPVNSQATERTNYPTQKPETLLERVLLACSNQGDLVFDAFMGSGTTQAVAMKLGRRFIGADINNGAIQTATRRLTGIQDDIKSAARQPSLPDGSPSIPYYLGFQVYTVNNYDVFRNPAQARDLLIQALEIEPLGRETYFDGVKDGYDVKLMPVNRIATKADVSDLIANLNYKQLDSRKKENPTIAQQRIMVVCMGHDPDLKPFFSKETEKYHIEFRVYDILRDGAHLTLKFPSEAKMSISKGKLRIERFYPHALMQKLSIQKTAAKEWKELAESIVIDPYYDGSNFTPTITDIPEKDGTVAGEYKLPDDHATVAVKITDLLSDTHFEVVGA